MKVRISWIHVLLVLVISLILLNISAISNALVKFFTPSNKVVILPSNEYKLDYDYMFVSSSLDYVPYSYNDLLDIYYSFLNNGWEKFTFYCPKEYGECLNDVKKISEDNTLLSHINNFVHPYNSFEVLGTVYDTSGEVTLSIEKLYSDEDVDKINGKVEEIMDELFSGKDDLDYYDKILQIHDYIINNTKYDKIRNETGESDYESTTAYGPLFQGYAMCGGYADAMALFLNELGLPNYKVAVPPEEDEDDKGHIWNAVYIDGKWLHLDLTWDDPVDDTGEDYLYHKYFLVNNDTLLSEDGSYVEHNFDKSVYLEFKN